MTDLQLLDRIHSLELDIAKLDAAIERAEIYNGGGILSALSRGLSRIGHPEPLIKEREAKQKALREYREYLDVLPDSNSESEPIVWKGPKVELAEWILAAYQKGHLEADKPLEALRKVAQHIRMPDGTPLDPRSLWQNLQNRKDFKKNS